MWLLVKRVYIIILQKEMWLVEINSVLNAKVYICYIWENPNEQSIYAIEEVTKFHDEGSLDRTE